MSAPVMLGCAVAVIIFGGSVMGVSAHVEARHRAAGAADGAALAAADAAAGWIDADPCELAAEVARSYEVQVTSCTVDFERAEARIEATVSTPLFAVQQRARAGPGATRTAIQ